MALSWTAATDNATAQGAIVYDIYQSASSTVDYAAAAYVTNAGATSFTVTGLAAGTTYYFAVRARDAGGNRDTVRARDASAGHCNNIMSASYKVVGVGYAADAQGTAYWTQNFGGQ